MDSTKNPLVSICISVRNGVPLLSNAIESALNQTYKNIEVVIFDDDSTDDTEGLVKKYLQKEGGQKIKYERASVNLGVLKGLSKVVELSSGDFFQLLPHDDWLSRNYVEECIKEFDKHPDAAIVAARWINMRERDRVYTFVEKTNVRVGYYTTTYYMRHAYDSFLPSIVTLGMVRRKDAESAALYMEEFVLSPPESFPEELAVLEKHGYGADLVWSIPFLLKHKGFVISDKMSFMKTLMPLEHYMTSKKSMKLRTEYGINEYTAKGILKRDYYRRLCYDHLFGGYKGYKFAMRVFFGKEILASLFVSAIKYRFPKRFFYGFEFKTLARFFNGFTPVETFLSFVLFIPRIVERLVKSFIRNIASVIKIRRSDIYKKVYFLNEQGRFLV